MHGIRNNSQVGWDLTESSGQSASNSWQTHVSMKFMLLPRSGSAVCKVLKCSASGTSEAKRGLPGDRPNRSCKHGTFVEHLQGAEPFISILGENEIRTQGIASLGTLTVAAAPETRRMKMDYVVLCLSEL